jgi:hypothetical protein
MEKEKPFNCETCGKRYKNLNGLKYHKTHSIPCSPEFMRQAEAAGLTLPQARLLANGSGNGSPEMANMPTMPNQQAM